MYVFDAHTHFFSRVFYEYQARQAPRHDIHTMMDRLARAGIDVPGADHDAHRNRMVRDLDANGIERAVIFASVPDENEVVGRAAATSSGRLVAYATLNPLIDGSVDAFEASCSELDIRGILLFPALHDYPIGDASVRPVLDLAGGTGMVVFVHCGLLRVPVRSVLGLEPDFPLHRGHPDDLIPVASQHPNVRFVVPHFGAGFFDEFLRLGKACSNVFADTAGSNTWGMFQAPELYLEDLFEQTADTYGIDRMLFGSDSAGYPRGYRRDILEAQLRAMHDAGISPADRELIMGGNLSRLLEV